jgi:hypothetical protein
MNSFEKSAQIYLGIQGGFSTPGDKPTTVFTSGILEVDGASGRKIQLGADSSNSAYLDFKSRDGGSADYDSRIISQFGSTGSTAGEGILSVQADVLQLLTTNGVRIGSINAPAFKMDYNSTAATTGTNQDTVITFTAGLFTVAPKVIVSLVDTDGPGTPGADMTPYVYSITTSGCTVRGLGVMAASIRYDWLALGV